MLGNNASRLRPTQARASLLTGRQSKLPHEPTRALEYLRHHYRPGARGYVLRTDEALLSIHRCHIHPFSLDGSHERGVVVVPNPAGCKYPVSTFYLGP